MERTSSEKNYYYIILVLLTLAAFLIRIEVVRALLLVDSNILYPAAVTDMATYYKLANEIANGTFKGPYYYQPFYYGVFLAGFFKFMPGKIFTVLVGQALLGALTIYFSAQTAKRLYSRNAGLITAILITFSQTLIFYTSYMLLVTVQAFLITMILYFTVIAYRKNRSIYWGISGLVLGCAVLTRGNMWLVFPGIFIIVLIRGITVNWKRDFILKILPVLMFTVFFFLPMIPFIFYNTLESGTLTGPSTAAGAVLLFGNTPESPPGGNEAQYGAGIMAPTDTGNYWSKTSEKISVIERIYDYWKSNPLAYLELTFRKLLLFWDMKEIPNNVDINHSYEICRPLQIFGLVPTFIIIILGCAGLLFFIPSIFWKKTEFILPFYILISYWLSISIFYILGRFRAPIIPVLAVYGGCLASMIISYSKEKGRNVAVGLLLMLLMTLVSLHGYNFYRYHLEDRIMKVIKPNGTTVKLEKETLVFDNGPMLYGSWKLIKLEKDLVFTKRFVIHQEMGNKSAYLKLPVFFKNNGSVTFSVNGKEYTFYSGKDRNTYIKIRLNDYVKVNISKTKSLRVTVDVKVEKTSGAVYIFYDAQRDYGRSFVNDKLLNGEIVAKFIYTDSNY